ncbi:TPA: type II toxin-antitoxin system RelE/ParE family toxin [Citrobacter farmeri]|uniref:type II toxin-antitoxin system RelE family toxin n=1 Tax=Citrobacter farmeri TaxID=67824 RepID=UPI0018997BF4|nr:type II toxin-antitoxin system RelE/ParE family toxin [Citrobacter farmeri]MBU5645002.1 type II toxin-antitoxin system RelE/ParE family toxin [Pluralibacter sp. S54_ASV_43]HAT3753713.1 type II toxin-antitoxin system RelE/ParE family toxin [Citrobacter amalonaticus]HAU5702455.1 type II toxin-antitoxin system RelE/ParE family toxin [Citrobacter freundii]EKU0079696.1 type II toxin-antitoxin system RelE/ParE family toxin [Citrobacter farmeri]MBJ9134649.1 type II toxin-antitoxin system RelE/ParE
MSYELAFDPRALKEWQKLGETVKNQFRKKLAEVLSHPRIPSARLHDFPDCYKIKLKASGFRLVYQVKDAQVLILVIAIGKREKSAAYQNTDKRL